MINWKDIKCVYHLFHSLTKNANAITLKKYW